MDGYEGILMAGDDLHHVWCDPRTGGKKIRETGTVPPPPARAGCAATGCFRCDSRDCYYAGFIRDYWRYPRFD